ncbi:iron oxidase [Microbulbifer aestuariivivens]|uniref:High-potential iron-sulfur protein n=1 Tax=Microbulbifer aestuariivivens TaxID=1908308 RepID=A0ABP9WLX1_9GAMM
MSDSKPGIERRKFLRLMGCSAVLIPAVMLPEHKARAQGKASQAAVQYQDTPKNGQKCVDCQFWTDPDACQVVEGKISPEGWCSLYVKKMS